LLTWVAFDSENLFESSMRQNSKQRLSCQADYILKIKQHKKFWIKSYNVGNIFKQDWLWNQAKKKEIGWMDIIITVEAA